MASDTRRFVLTIESRGLNKILKSLKKLDKGLKAIAKENTLAKGFDRVVDSVNRLDRTLNRLGRRSVRGLASLSSSLGDVVVNSGRAEEQLSDVNLQLGLMSDQLRDLNNSTNRFGDNIRNVGTSTARLNQQTNITRSNLQGIAQATNNSSRAFSKMAGAVGGLVPIYAAYAANVFVLTAAFNALSEAFDFRQAIAASSNFAARTGIDLANIVGSIREITGSAVDLQTAFRQVNLAAGAGFGAETIEKLATAGTNASKALGVDLTDAINRVFRGAVKAEPELLDELGIILRLKPATEKYAKELGIAASQLTTFQRQQGIANEVIRQAEQKFGDLSKIEANPYKKLSADISESIKNVLNKITDFIRPIIDFFTNNKSGLAGAAAFATLAIFKMSRSMAGFGRATTSSIDAASNSLEAYRERLQNIVDLQQRASLSRARQQGLSSGSTLTPDFGRNVARDLANSFSSAAPDIRREISSIGAHLRENLFSVTDARQIAGRLRGVQQEIARIARETPSLLSAEQIAGFNESLASARVGLVDFRSELRGVGGSGSVGRFARLRERFLEVNLELARGRTNAAQFTSALGLISGTTAALREATTNVQRLGVGLNFITAGLGKLFNVLQVSAAILTVFRKELGLVTDAGDRLFTVSNRLKFSLDSVKNVVEEYLGTISKLPDTIDNTVTKSQSFSGALNSLADNFKKVSNALLVNTGELGLWNDILDKIGLGPIANIQRSVTTLISTLGDLNPILAETLAKAFSLDLDNLLGDVKDLSRADLQSLNAAAAQLTKDAGELASKQTSGFKLLQEGLEEYEDAIRNSGVELTKYDKLVNATIKSLKGLQEVGEDGLLGFLLGSSSDYNLSLGLLKELNKLKDKQIKIELVTEGKLNIDTLGSDIEDNIDSIFTKLREDIVSNITKAQIESVNLQTGEISSLIPKENIASTLKQNSIFNYGDVLEFTAKEIKLTREKNALLNRTKSLIKETRGFSDPRVIVNLKKLGIEQSTINSLLNEEIIKRKELKDLASDTIKERQQLVTLNSKLSAIEAEIGFGSSIETARAELDSLTSEVEKARKQKIEDAIRIDLSNLVHVVKGSSQDQIASELKLNLLESFSEEGLTLDDITNSFNIDKLPELISEAISNAFAGKSTGLSTNLLDFINLKVPKDKIDETVKQIRASLNTDKLNLVVRNTDSYAKGVRLVNSALGETENIAAKTAAGFKVINDRIDNTSTTITDLNNEAFSTLNTYVNEWGTLTRVSSVYVDNLLNINKEYNNLTSQQKVQLSNSIKFLEITRKIGEVTANISLVELQKTTADAIRELDKIGSFDVTSGVSDIDAAIEKYTFANRQLLEISRLGITLEKEKLTELKAQLGVYEQQITASKEAALIEAERANQAKIRSLNTQISLASLAPPSSTLSKQELEIQKFLIEKQSERAEIYDSINIKVETLIDKHKELGTASGERKALLDSQVLALQTGIELDAKTLSLLEKIIPKQKELLKLQQSKNIAKFNAETTQLAKENIQLIQGTPQGVIEAQKLVRDNLKEGISAQDTAVRELEEYKNKKLKERLDLETKAVKDIYTAATSPIAEALGSAAVGEEDAFENLGEKVADGVKSAYKDYVTKQFEKTFDNLFQNLFEPSIEQQKVNYLQEIANNTAGIGTGQALGGSSTGQQVGSSVGSLFGGSGSGSLIGTLVGKVVDYFGTSQSTTGSVQSQQLIGGATGIGSNTTQLTNLDTIKTNNVSIDTKQTALVDKNLSSKTISTTAQNSAINAVGDVATNFASSFLASKIAGKSNNPIVKAAAAVGSQLAVSYIKTASTKSIEAANTQFGESFNGNLAGAGFQAFGAYAARNATTPGGAYASNLAGFAASNYATTGSISGIGASTTGLGKAIPIIGWIMQIVGAYNTIQQYKNANIGFQDGLIEKASADAANPFKEGTFLGDFVTDIHNFLPNILGLGDLEGAFTKLNKITPFTGELNGLLDRMFSMKQNPSLNIRYQEALSPEELRNAEENFRVVGSKNFSLDRQGPLGDLSVFSQHDLFGDNGLEKMEAMASYFDRLLALDFKLVVEATKRFGPEGATLLQDVARSMFKNIEINTDDVNFDDSLTSFVVDRYASFFNVFDERLGSALIVSVDNYTKESGESTFNLAGDVANFLFSIYSSFIDDSIKMAAASLLSEKKLSFSAENFAGAFSFSLNLIENIATRFRGTPESFEATAIEVAGVVDRFVDNFSDLKERLKKEEKELAEGTEVLFVRYIERVSVDLTAGADNFTSALEQITESIFTNAEDIEALKASLDFILLKESPLSLAIVNFQDSLGVTLAATESVASTLKSAIDTAESAQQASQLFVDGLIGSVKQAFLDLFINQIASGIGKVITGPLFATLTAALDLGDEDAIAATQKAIADQTSLLVQQTALVAEAVGSTIVPMFGALEEAINPLGEVAASLFSIGAQVSAPQVVNSLSEEVEASTNNINGLLSSLDLLNYETGLLNDRYQTEEQFARLSNLQIQELVDWRKLENDILAQSNDLTAQEVTLMRQELSARQALNRLRTAEGNITNIRDEIEAGRRQISLLRNIEIPLNLVDDASRYLSLINDIVARRDDITKEEIELLKTRLAEQIAFEREIRSINAEREIQSVLPEVVRNFNKSLLSLTGSLVTSEEQVRDSLVGIGTYFAELSPTMTEGEQSLAMFNAGMEQFSANMDFFVNNMLTNTERALFNAVNFFASPEFISAGELGLDIEDGMLASRLSAAITEQLDLGNIEAASALAGFTRLGIEAGIVIDDISNNFIGSFVTGMNALGFSVDMQAENLNNFARDFTAAFGGLEEFRNAILTFSGEFIGENYKNFLARQFNLEDIQSQISIRAGALGFDSGTITTGLEALSSISTKSDFLAFLQEVAKLGDPELYARVLDFGVAASEAGILLGDATDDIREAFFAIAQEARNFAEQLKQDFRDIDKIRRDALARGTSNTPETFAQRSLQALVNNPFANSLFFGTGQLPTDTDVIVDQARVLLDQMQSYRESILELYDQQIQAERDRLEATEEFLKGLKDFRLQEGNTTLSFQERFGLAQSRFLETLKAAQGGDTDALRRILAEASEYANFIKSGFGDSEIAIRLLNEMNQGLNSIQPVSEEDYNKRIEEYWQTAVNSLENLDTLNDELIKFLKENELNISIDGLGLTGEFIGQEQQEPSLTEQIASALEIMTQSGLWSANGLKVDPQETDPDTIIAQLDSISFDKSSTGFGIHVNTLGSYINGLANLVPSIQDLIVAINNAVGAGGGSGGGGSGGGSGGGTPPPSDLTARVNAFADSIVKADISSSNLSELFSSAAYAFPNGIANVSTALQSRLKTNMLAGGYSDAPNPVKVVNPTSQHDNDVTLVMNPGTEKSLATQAANNLLNSTFSSVGILGGYNGNPYTTQQLNDGVFNALWGHLSGAALEESKNSYIPFESGTPFVPRDMPANVHQGEIIIDPASSKILRDYGIQIDGSSNAEMVALMRELIGLIRDISTDKDISDTERNDKLVLAVEELRTNDNSLGALV